MLPIETNIKKIERQAIINENSNFRFRSFLKTRVDPDELDQAVHKLHKKITAQIDCCECASC